MYEETSTLAVCNSFSTQCWSGGHFGLNTVCYTAMELWRLPTYGLEELNICAVVDRQSWLDHQVLELAITVTDFVSIGRSCDISDLMNKLEKRIQRLKGSMQSQLMVCSLWTGLLLMYFRIHLIRTIRHRVLYSIWTLLILAIHKISLLPVLMSGVTTLKGVRLFLVQWIQQLEETST